MRKVTLSQMLAILDRHPGAAIVTMVVRTDPVLLVKSRADGTPAAERWPYGVEKLCLGQFALATRYQGNVRQQRRREGHPRPDAFRSGKLWHGKGERVGRCLARHTGHGRLYWVARPRSDEQGRPIKLWERWIDLARGVDLVGEELAELKANWLKDRPNGNPKQQVCKKIPYRTYHVVSVRSVKIGGEVYQVEPGPAADVV